MKKNLLLTWNFHGSVIFYSENIWFRQTVAHVKGQSNQMKNHDTVTHRPTNVVVFCRCFVISCNIIQFVSGSFSLCS
jgi:hypothetical protein